MRQRDWDARCAQAAESRFDVGRISTSAQAVIGLLEKLLTVAVIGFGAVLVFDGQMTVGALIAFNMLSGRVTAPLAQIVGLVQGYQEAGLSVRMLGQIMNRPPELISQLRIIGRLADFGSGAQFGKRFRGPDAHQRLPVGVRLV